jgi:hypothetical protein
VDKQISGLTSGRIEPKSKWQPNAYETMQVQKLLQDLREGKITLDELKGKTKKDDPEPRIPSLARRRRGRAGYAKGTTASSST